MNARYAIGVGGLAVALGLSALTGPAVASADDGTGSAAPGPSAASASSEDDVTLPPLKAGANVPTTNLGNGRTVGSSMSSSIAGSASQYASRYDADAAVAEAEAKMVESANNSDAYVDQMLDDLADMRSQMKQIAANGQPERMAPRNLG